MSEAEHRAAAPQRLKVLVVTLSDSRDPTADTSGAWLHDALVAAGHSVDGPHIVRENPLTLFGELQVLIGKTLADAVIVNGGTGIAPRDQAPEVLARLYDRTLPGFGELFRALSFDEIGSAAYLSRASAGIVGRKPVFSIPGSRNAVRLAFERLILPELGHLVGELQRPAGGVP